MLDFVLDRLPGTEILLLGCPPRGKSSLVQPSVFTNAFNNYNSNLRWVGGADVKSGRT